MLSFLENIDRKLLFAINGCHSEAVDHFFWIVSEKYFGIPFYILFLILIYKSYGVKGALIFLILGGLCIGLVDLSSKHLFKDVFERYRPSKNLEIMNQLHYVNNYRGGNYGFISNHAANMFAITFFTLFCLFRSISNYWYLLLILFPILVGYSRIYLGVHYPSDVIAGGIWGLIIALIFSRIFASFLSFERSSQK